ncbi:methylated-DNA--[protein]-cysteine S-methyltransferase [Ammoniphilus resinae]|uniref:Methylated-DNA--protein-cysteine methyltransferase n=1 Tax=Ammoniphilus resinae TaxID=861532 RepID=A0ABS4GJ37_9BACL|nr:methylated-DNA--[protein]-cysteine S-methyltransferase [Ammoniphilus resinae]MBP1930266.1 O-6-methylguanine DNA methyltransferase [Ammoniphilus resinae]
MVQSTSLFYTEMESPIGMIGLAATETALCWITFDSGPSARDELRQWGKKWLRIEQHQIERNRVLQQAVVQLQEYFLRQRTEFELPLAIYGTPFQKSVWNQLQKIPYGEVRSYKDIAVAISSSKAVRAVGGANNKNPLSIVIPCHRVIGSNGSLTGYGGGLPIKEFLLGMEASHRSQIKEAQ